MFRFTCFRIIPLFVCALGLSILPARAAEEVPERADVPAEFRWDLTAMYADTAAWEADRERFLAVLPEIENFKGRLAESGETLLAALKKSEEIELIVANLYVYAGLKSNEDTRVSENAARFSEAQGLLSQYQQTMAFFSPELLAIPEAELETLVTTTPGLDIYRHALDEVQGATDIITPVATWVFHTIANLAQRRKVHHGTGLMFFD